MGSSLLWSFMMISEESHFNVIRQVSLLELVGTLCQ